MVSGENPTAEELFGYDPESAQGKYPQPAQHRSPTTLLATLREEGESEHDPVPCALVVALLLDVASRVGGHQVVADVLGAEGLVDLFRVQGPSMTRRG